MCYSPVIRSQPLVSLWLWAVNFKKVPQTSFPLFLGTGWPEWAGAGYFHSSRSVRLWKPHQVRLWLTSFPWGQAWLRRTECSGYLKNGSFPLQEAGVIFIQYLLWEPSQAPRGKSQSCGGPRDSVPLGFLPLRVVHPEPSAIYQLQLQSPYPSILSSGAFCSWVCAHSLYLPTLSFLVFPMLGAAICTVSSLLLPFQEKLLIFQSVQHFTC